MGERWGKDYGSLCYSFHGCLSADAGQPFLLLSLGLAQRFCRRQRKCHREEQTKSHVHVMLVFLHHHANPLLRQVDPVPQNTQAARSSCSGCPTTAQYSRSVDNGSPAGVWAEHSAEPTSTVINYSTVRARSRNRKYWPRLDFLLRKGMGVSPHYRKFSIAAPDFLLSPECSG